MPEHADPPSIGEQLEKALEETGVSQSELARRLSTETATAESKRRWILKVLADEEIESPDMGPVAKALGLPNDYFVMPTPEQVERRRVRLAELEAEVEQIKTERAADLEAVVAQLADLADRLKRVERREEPPSSQEEGQ